MRSKANRVRGKKVKTISTKKRLEELEKKYQDLFDGYMALNRMFIERIQERIEDLTDQIRERNVFMPKEKPKKALGVEDWIGVPKVLEELEKV